MNPAGNMLLFIRRTTIPQNDSPSLSLTVMEKRPESNFQISNGRFEINLISFFLIYSRKNK